MNIEITGEFIKIGQLLKKMKIIVSGGAAKNYLENTTVKINGKIITKRSSKVKPGDTIWIGYKVYYVKAKV